MKKILCLFLLLFISNNAINAQTLLFQHDTSIKVYAYGAEQTLAWCGGFNKPQFAMGDLNNDGLQDLVVYESGIGVWTYLNKGSVGNPKYIYAPEYALNFPPIYNYLILADYNCDGIPDLFHRGFYGFSVYKGYYNTSNQLCFTFYQDLYYYNDIDTHGPANAYVNPGDIPAIVDIDGDGDLDFVSYEPFGGWLYYYKNMRVEDGLPCDSIRIKLVDKCWGKVFQSNYRVHELDMHCDNSSLHKTAHVTHTGNTPCLFDWDMDGDYDYLDGNISFNEMTFLLNGRIPNNPSGPDSMAYQDTMWQSFGHQIEIPTWPAAFNVDIDQDGKKDLLISPNSASTGAENYKCIWFYKNYTTPGSPGWVFQSDTFLIDKTIDLGTAAMPALFDYDKDGKPDLFIGSDGYFQDSTGLLRSKISYYRNTSVAGSASFTLVTKDFLGINAANFQGIAPAFGDIDNDGKTDMILGHNDGTLSYYKNMAATDSLIPDWQLVQTVLTDSIGDTINVGSFAAPFIYDIDKDGKKDLIIGENYGFIQFYRNVSTVPGTISLKLINSQLGGVQVDNSFFRGCYSTPFIGKIDSTNKDYLLIGSNSGNIYLYDSVDCGDTTITYPLLSQNFSYIDSTYLWQNAPGTFYGIYSGFRSSLTIGDIAGDGSLEMIVGNIKGGVEIYKRKLVSHVQIPTINEQENASITVYPNPAKDLLNIKWKGIKETEIEISIYNTEGQLIYAVKKSSIDGIYTQSIATLPTGMYFCQLQSGVNRYYSKFTVVK